MANPGAAVSGLGLAADAIKGNQPVKGERQLNQAAAADTANGNQLQSYIQSGQLPPGAQASIASAANAQKASIRNRYAQEGSSGSSSEQQDLAAVDAWSQGQGSQLAMQLLQQGISESNLGAQLYGDISKTALQQDQSLGSAFGSFASSLAGGGGSSPKGTITFGNG
jgi:hypothetical protein